MRRDVSISVKILGRAVTRPYNPLVGTSNGMSSRKIKIIVNFKHFRYSIDCTLSIRHPRIMCLAILIVGQQYQVNPHDGLAYLQPYE